MTSSTIKNKTQSRIDKNGLSSTINSPSFNGNVKLPSIKVETVRKPATLVNSR